jgi:uncharacterized protein (TIGR02145 family)
MIKTLLLFILTVVSDYAFSQAYNLSGSSNNIIDIKLVDAEGNILFNSKSIVESKYLNSGTYQINFDQVPLEIIAHASLLRIAIIDQTSRDTLMTKMIKDFNTTATQLKSYRNESDQLLKIQNDMIEQGILNQISFWYDGELVTFGVVKHRDRYWLDRNLGASQVAKSLNDTLAYGDLFQWGRKADGHQFYSTQAVLDEQIPQKELSLYTNFFTSITGFKSWASQWCDGTRQMETSTNVCPDGWHVPSAIEWITAMEYWDDLMDAFNSSLKIPASYVRHSDGKIESRNDKIHITGRDFSVHYWCSTPNYQIHGQANATYMKINSKCNLFDVYNFTNGMPVRCIKDKSPLK